ncbi:hypothetical protein [Nonomuraea jiangxiensis]|uniref:Uncharacterized membrane protein (Does not regulate perfringolysin O expression) n=1 Tax=Nonomuraea jiangxiensis TaxID=633440 RepID=A0A1G9JRX9_9ACTN|nr:hypothetical protein [Nonomuraea jiangxiensis]SDL40026.1 Uncharacterized membrane protein (does not regulate perfringolysin O expression) [Nonomuraea jiangxiensis]
MGRYRFGRIAALIALGYLVALAVLGVIALTTDRGDLLWKVVTRQSSMDWFFSGEESTITVSWGLAVVLLLIGTIQAWALWQVLRGRAQGELTRRGRTVGLLRLALYLGVGYALFSTVSAPLIVAWDVPWPWSVTDLVSGFLQLAIVWLFFLVLRDTVSRRLRLFSVVAGSIACLSGIGQEIATLLGGPALVMRIVSLTNGYGYVLLAWSVSILIAQAKDPRWSAATVRIGVISQVAFLIQPSGMVTFGDGGIPGIFTVYTLIGAASVFGLVWDARTAHELANPLSQPVSAQATARPAARRWPLPAVAIVLPLIPAAVNLAHGRYHWIGPRGVIEWFVRVDGGSLNAVAWLALDVFVGVGGPALLVLAAVLRRTHRSVRFATLTLTIAAAVGFVSALTTTRGDSGFDEYFYEGTQIYPEGLFTGTNGETFFGISPSWYSAALLASALLLMFLYPAAPAQRVRLHVPLAALVVLGFVPVADQIRGPVTSAEKCDPRDTWSGGPTPPQLTRDQRLVCSLRRGELIKFAATTPDAVILAHARRLCGIYTRNDPHEVTRLQTAEGLRRDSLTYPLAEICPSAGAAVKAAAAKEEREMQAWEADAQRMCDSAPRHRPLVEPAKVTRMKEPQRTDYGVVESYEPTEDDADPYEDGLLERAQKDGLVAALPGHLMVLTHSDFDLCVTLETYTRRPPVETKGWDHVAEVGYESPTGQIVLRDDLSGTEFPDLSLNGRAGHYRIRVHYDWFEWKGSREAGQRLLIMAFPGKGDKPVTYRKPAKR